jgi:hypothetical protein
MSEAIHAKLTKVSTLPGATVDPFGARGQGPIGQDYYVKGYYLDSPTIGQPFYMTRYNSNGVEVDGLFRTSPVESVDKVDDHIVFRTMNSTYRLEAL